MLRLHRNDFRSDTEYEEYIDTLYDSGYNQALRDYAWWKDGEQYVGNCGAKLKDVLKYRERECNK